MYFRANLGSGFGQIYSAKEEFLRRSWRTLSVRIGGLHSQIAILRWRSCDEDPACKGVEAVSHKSVLCHISHNVDGQHVSAEVQKAIIKRDW